MSKDKNDKQISEEFEEELVKMLEEKELKMCEFLNTYMSGSERYRIGEDIIRNMPNAADIAHIKIKFI